MLRFFGRGGGRGRGGSDGAPRGGRMGGTAAGPGGMCRCPQCGRREPHRRGVPCTASACPACGTRMVRE